MKKIFSFAVVALLGIGAVNAQARDTINGRGPRKERREMAGNMNMTEEQRAAAKANRDQFRAEMKALDEDKSLTAEQKQAKRKALQEAYVSKMQSMMTPEQKAKMQENRENWRENRKDGRMGRDSVGKKGRMERKSAGKKMAHDLNLTAEQKQKMKEANKDFKAKATAIKSNSSLTAEQKKDQLKALHNQRKAQMATVLNKEQLQKVKEAHKERENRPARVAK